MILLIDKAIVAEKLQVAIGYDTKEFNTFINEAQEFDLKPLIPESFFYDLLKNKDVVLWKNIIDGGEYTHTVNDTSRTYYHQGLASVLSYFAYGRFVMNSSAVSTSHGMVVKTNPNSTPILEPERKNFWYKKKEEANLLLDDVIKFIIRNKEDYPSWHYYFDNDIINGNPDVSGYYSNCPVGYGYDHNYPANHPNNSFDNIRNRSQSGGATTRVIQ